MKQLLKKTRQNILIETREDYETAWQSFWKIGASLSKRWKTKKNSMQVLKEERM